MNIDLRRLSLPRFIPIHRDESGQSTINSTGIGFSNPYCGMGEATSPLRLQIAPQMSTRPSDVRRDKSQPSIPVGRASPIHRDRRDPRRLARLTKPQRGDRCAVNLVICGRCRVWKLDLQVERSEIPTYRGSLATCVIQRHGTEYQKPDDHQHDG